MKIKMLAVAMGAAALSMQAQAVEMQRVWIEAQPGKLAAVEKLLTDKSVQTHYRFAGFDAVVVTAPKPLLDRLARNANVRGIEEDAKRFPMAQEVPYGIDMVQARDIWDSNRDGAIDASAPTGAGRMVCIIDSGIDAAHPDLADLNLVGGFPDGWDTDTCGHGSHVAGTIAAVNNSIGVVGVSPGAVSLFIGKVFDGESCAYSYSSSVANAALLCLEAGADVINMSLGGGLPNTSEARIFRFIAERGTLPVAAAGNNGTSRKSYPASYASVLSVAAVDSAGTVASFSQFNDGVDIAAPGVDVLSTVPFGSVAELTVNGVSYSANGLDLAAAGSATGAIVDGGLCTAAGAWAGKVVLCQRGDISFGEKVAAAQTGGAVGAIIYNNEPGNFTGTLGDYPSTIPAVSIAQEDGQAIVAGALGTSATVSIEVVEHTYANYSGTSMATPHVAGVAAVLLSSDASLVGNDVREAMIATALDLGTAGRDDYYGAGLVQAFDAWQALGGSPADVRPPLRPGQRVATR